MYDWVLTKFVGNVPEISESLGISPVAARVLCNRRVNTAELAREYLSPALTDDDIKDLRETVQIVKKFIASRERIFVYGDYDADGVTSTVIIYKTLKDLGADVFYYIPDREAEGYGLNMPAIGFVAENGCKLLITVDNGIAAIPEIKRAKELGLTVCVIDHHEQGEFLPNADSIIDPKRRDCASTFKGYCAAGLCYLFAKELYKSYNKPNPRESEFLIFAALATVCDIVPLLGNNRVLVRNGLIELNKKENLNIGLQALMDEKSLTEIKEYDIGFIIGPCINATGRLETAKIAVALFTTDDREMAAKWAQTLSGLNEERKRLTKLAYEGILIPDDKVIVIYDEEIHESIAGIVAGRVKERVNHPAVVLTKSSEEGCAKGSARSVEGYDIFEELSKCADLFTRFGGHPMAAGLSLRTDDIDELRTRLNENCTLSDFTAKLKIDALLDLSEVNFALAKELEVLSPFGSGNHKPLFSSLCVSLASLKLYENKNTIIFTFETDDRPIKGVCFGAEFIQKLTDIISESYPAETEKILSGVIRNTPIILDIVYHIEINEYKGNYSRELRIKDFRRHKERNV
ncbi:single-stranded-DNA-specific exonuclease RecJ [Clostridia bacterium]|nr:single-stranded-DNA-specific exonuclease RecJ [Clostridia bacterium]